MGSKIGLFLHTYKKYLLLLLLILILIPSSFLLVKNVFDKQTKTYSVTTFNSNIVQVVAGGNILEGKGIPNSKVLVSITPGEIKQEITTDIKGDWSYTIPKSAKSGSYNLTILILDKQGNAASVKSYPLKITFNKNYQQFALVSQVSAFTSTPTGRIRASAVTVPTGQTYGVTQITVDQMQNFGSNALICVVSNAPNASPVTFAAPGSSAPWSGYTAASYTDPNNGPWIASGVRYTFNLYNWNSGSANHSDCTGTPVATVVVDGPGGSTTQCSKENQFCQNNENCQDGTSTCQNFSCLMSNPSGGICIKSTTPPTPKHDFAKLGSEYDDWVARMKRLSIYPAKDIRTGEIVFISREDYQEQVCNNDPSCISPRFDEFIDGIKNHNFEYIIALGNKLREHPNCYVAFEALQPYFGDAQDFFEGARLDLFKTTDFGSLKYMYNEPLGCVGQVKHSINEDTLAQFIHQTAASYSQDKDDPNHDFFTTTETASLGFLPSSVILKLIATRDGYNPDSGLAADTAFAIANFLPIGKVGGAIKQVSKVGSHSITSRTTLDLSRLTGQMRSIREAIQSKAGSGLRKGEKVSQETMQSQIDNTIERNLHEITIGRIPTSISTLPIIRIQRTESTENLVNRFGNVIGTGKNAVVYGNGSIATKIGPRDPDSILREIQILLRADGAGGLAKVYNVIQDETGKIIGYGMEQINGKSIQRIVQDQGTAVDLTVDERIQFLKDFVEAHEKTGLAHGDLFSIMHTNPGNLILEVSDNGVKRIRMVDYGSQALADIKWEEESAPYYFFLKYESHGFIKETAEAEKIGQEIIDTMKKGKSLKQALDSLILDPEATIIDVLVSGDKITARIIETENGVITSHANQLKEVFTLGQTTPQGGIFKTVHAQGAPTSITQLSTIPAQEISSGVYQITIPGNTQPGTNCLKAYLYEQGSNEILDESDCQNITIEIAPKTVTSIKINDQEVDLESLTLDLHLPGTNGQAQNFAIPIEITYSDGTTKHLAYNFNYNLPGQTTPPAILTARPNPVPDGSGNGQTAISWNTGSLSSGQVRMYDPSNPPGVNCSSINKCLFGEAQSATQWTNATGNADGGGAWIATGHTYIFELYSGSCTKEDCSDRPLLNSVIVTRGGSATPGLQSCIYSEATRNCPNGGTRTCSGSLQDDICKYDPNINPDCNETCDAPHSCIYSETPHNCSNGGTRTCTGTIQNNVCTYDASVDTNCQETCNAPQSCTYSETPQNCFNGGTRTCTGTIQSGVCKYDAGVNPNCNQQCNALQSCTYSETPQGCSNGGTRTCTGNLQNGVCKYNPSVNPNCHQNCNPPPCTTSCGKNNGQNCTNMNKANIECADYYEDNSTCSRTNSGPRGDGCIP